ncbi:MAG: hypothetical protein HeimC3_38510 [Candidatus Heimdallarchaeota archaeon LC_3]|nr:MAG: hypothetical protein HeimC3_38510 [Candidatus Heimdallarchaeota archaeon LC_3]
MATTYRHLEQESDIELQHEIWLSATKNLPWAWKPNKTQKLFFNKENFDRRSKYFAFNSNRKIVGYMSFINLKDFIPIGYPWTYPQDNIVRDHMWENMINILNEDFPKKYFLQRLRSEWKEQKDFFLDKGFKINKEYPIYVFDLQNQLIPNVDLNGYNFDIHQSINNQYYELIYNSKEKSSPEGLENAIWYNSTLDYDLCIFSEKNSSPLSYAGITSRFDLKYSEIAFLENFKDKTENSKHVLVKTLKELKKQGINNVSITLDDQDPSINLIKELGFKSTSKSVYVKLERD